MMLDVNRNVRSANLGWLRFVGWGAAAALLLLPLVAMTIAPDSGVNWTVGDFLFAGVVIGAVGLAFELAVRTTSNWAYRAGAAVGLAAAFFLTWANAAVGYIGDESVYNIVFFGIVASAILGAILVRFTAGGLAIVMLATGIAHAVTGALGYPEDPVTGPITIVFTLLWLTSAWLFRMADKARATG